jgi:hypothetical protein
MIGPIGPKKNPRNSKQSATKKRRDINNIDEVNQFISGKY